MHIDHGFRDTASTWLSETKLFDTYIVEAQLAHQERNEVRRIYNRSDERVRMMQLWADEIDRLRRDNAYFG